MKKIIISLAVIFVVVLGTTFMIGNMAKSKIEEKIADLDSNQSFSATIVRYEQGLLNSEAEIEIGIEMPNANDLIEMPTIDIALNIQHGPFLTQSGDFGFGIFDANISVILPADVQQELDKIDEINENTLAFAIRSKFDGATRANISMEPFEINKDGDILSVKKAAGFIDFNKTGKLNSDIVWEGLSLTEEEKSLEVGTLKILSNQQLVSGRMMTMSALFEGEASVTLEKILVTPAPQQNFVMENFAITSKSEINDDISNAAMSMTIDKVSFIAFVFNNFAFDMAFNNMDTEGLKEVNMLVAEMQSSMDPAITQQFMTALGKMFSKNPEIHVNNLGVSTGQGDIKSDAHILMDSSIFDMNNPMSAIMAVKVKANAEAPAQFFSIFGMDAQVEALVQAGQLYRDGDLLRMDFSFANGQAILNGSPLNL
ncbi:MAG: YdgA family protein [Gammaproteobacteria bacterium]|nr:YdgA family protein [Gammaproteobacteria bacterium]MDH5628991.1 YdgA family protein [Gammaproteobacteria bacterium]